MREGGKGGGSTLRSFLLFFSSLFGSFSIFLQSQRFGHRSTRFNFLFDLLQTIFTNDEGGRDQCDSGGRKRGRFGGKRTHA